MVRITSKSKKRVLELMNPCPGYEKVVAPRGLTVRALLGHKQHKALLGKYGFAIIDGGHLICLGSLIAQGFDYYG